MADISTLQQSLINAKKIMNKVGDSNITRNSGGLTNSNPPQNINMESVQQHMPDMSSVQPLPDIPTSTIGDRQDLSPKSSITEERINKSKLPDAIKKAMIKNPIPDVPFGGGSVGLDEGFLKNVRTEMDKQGMPTNQTNVSKAIVEQVQTSNTKKISSGNLKSIIKEAVKELLDETITAKLNESIGPRTDAGENFQFTVGNKVFYGKITSSKTVK
jgi:hypothetical protein|tara:strand:- start:99 stop:743 length:645 start_codon:yes stop_codon:yes gene_type:complete